MNQIIQELTVEEIELIAGSVDVAGNVSTAAFGAETEFPQIDNDPPG